MSKKPQNLDDIFNEEEAKVVPEDTEAQKALLEKKRQEEFDRGVRLGWHDKEGNPLVEEKDEEEDEEDNDGEEI